jgi:hypothetical protein
MRRLAARVVWSAVIAAVCAVTALSVAIVYGEAERVVVLALVGGGITFAILATRP